MKRNKALSLIVVAVLLISVVAFTGCSIIADTVNGATTQPSEPIGRHEIDIENIESPSIGEVVANNCLESVCMITAGSSSGFVSTVKLGSGFFVNEDGYLLTNEHVVEGRDKFTVTVAERLPNGTTVQVDYQTTRLVAKSPELDLAIIQVVPPTKVKFNYLTFAKEKEVSYGETVFSIGNPDGLFFSMLSGIVANPSYKVVGKDAFKHIVIDANVNHGNSGGALINANSKVVGVIDARLEGKNGNEVYGLGLAIPGSVAREFLTENMIQYYIEEVPQEQAA